MSGFIAVSVSLIGLSGVLFTMAIFIQMILSFPAMLSSNSQTYVQQQRKTYNISASLGFEEIEMDVDAELEDEYEYEYEYEQEEEEQENLNDSVGKWIDVVDEAMNSSNAKSETTKTTQGRTYRGAMRAESQITRGRPLRRGRRRTATTTRPGLYPKNTWRLLDDQSDYDVETDGAHETEGVPTHDRQHCHPTWRKTMAC